MTEVTLNDAQKGDSQEHLDAMAAKADGTTAPAAPAEPAKEPATERPAWLPKGFNTPEELAAAYAATQAQKVEDPATVEQADTAAQEAVKAAGLDMAALEARLLSDGSLADTDYAALQAAGISREMADTYIQGQQALGDALVGRMHETVGGKENFEGILEWASTALEPSEIAAFNRVVDSGDESTVKLALEGLAAKHSRAGQQRPNLLQGQRSASGSNPFRSIAEMTQAMGDPRYTKDQAYREDVMARLSVSNIM